MSSSMDTDTFPNPLPADLGKPPTKHALGGKIMLTAIVILFLVVILMIILHLYARWYLLRARRRNIRRRRHHLVFYIDPSTTTPPISHGLDQEVLKRLPVFTYKDNQELHAACMECAVCLCEFEESEEGRLLPNCGHAFHTECIDMWFQSHSTCPLCRNAVELLEGEDRGGESSSTRNVEGTKDESSSTTASEFRSSLSTVLSFRRILSWDGRRSSGGAVVADVEAGQSREESSPHLGVRS